MATSVVEGHSVRVLFVINGLGTGGAERSLAELIPGLPAHGIEPIVVAFHHRPAGVERDVVASDVAVHFVEQEGWIGRLRAVRALIRRLRPDVVHTTIFEADLVGRVAAIGTRAPVATSVVNTSYAGVRSEDSGVSPMRLRAARELDGFTARHLGAGFHAITEAVAHSAVEALRLDPADVVIVPRGRSVERLGARSTERRDRSRARLAVSPHEVLLLNVARREFQKGQSALVEAAKVLVDRGVPVRVVIAGREGSEAARLDELVVRLGLGGVVTMLGHVDEVPDLLVAADVFVFPSRFEGLGGAVLEALALQVPVVASDVPALREVLQDGELGLLVPVDQPARLADAVQDVVDRPDDAARRAQLGRDVFDERYRLDVVTAQMAEWLRSFVHGAPR